MQRGAESVEQFFPSDEDGLAAVQAGIVVAHRFARLLEELHVSAPIAVLGACWLLADLMLSAELRHGTPAAFTHAMVDRHIDTAIGELRAALITDPAKIQ